MCGARPQWDGSAAAGENAPAIMAGRQRRGRDSGDRRTELWLDVVAWRRLIAERDRRGVHVDGRRRERDTELRRDTMCMRAVTAVLGMFRLPGRTFTRVVPQVAARYAGVRGDLRRLRRVTVRDVHGGVTPLPIGSHQLLVRRIAVVHVREQCLGREEAEA